jgi:hypothetical protein
MRIGVIIPTRGDRPKLLDNAIRMMLGQTLRPVHVEFVCDEPSSPTVKDITKRYRLGYERIQKACPNLDLIALVEDDDYYRPEYLETMAAEWDKRGRPDLFGTTYTVYYHLRLRRWFIMNHLERSAAMNTFIRPGLSIDWCPDSEAYTDLHLWMRSNLKDKGKLFTPPTHLSIGMKHGIGLCGGKNHNDRLDRFVNCDASGDFLRANVDESSLDFYNKIMEEEFGNVMI